MGKVVCCYPDQEGKVRNIEVLVKPSQSGVGDYIATAPQHLRRHVSKVVVILPVEQVVQGGAAPEVAEQEDEVQPGQPDQALGGV